MGVTLQDVYTVEADDPSDEFFAPNVRGVLSATYNVRSLPMRIDYTGSITGPMRLPAYAAPFTRAVRSPTYSTHNVQTSWRIENGAEFYLSVKNVSSTTSSPAR